MFSNSISIGVKCVYFDIRMFTDYWWVVFNNSLYFLCSISYVSKMTVYNFDCSLWLFHWSRTIRTTKAEVSKVVIFIWNLKNDSQDANSNNKKCCFDFFIYFCNCKIFFFYFSSAIFTKWCIFFNFFCTISNLISYFPTLK